MAAEDLPPPHQGINLIHHGEEECNVDIPLVVGSTARTGGDFSTRLQFTELHPLPDVDQLPADQVTKSWELNYREASIFLEEGVNNDKFASHPHCHEALPAYLVVHNKLYYCLDLFSALLLISLAFTEKPANVIFKLPVGVHSSIEILALLIISIELFMKLRWLGWRTFIKHPRSMVKAVTLLIMLSESIVVLVRQSSHFRVTRAIRPIFLVDNYYFRGVRRYLRQVLQSVPPALDMLGLLLFVILFFSVLGFYLFGSNVVDPYFSTLQQSFISLFVLLTTANYPDVMMPCYAVNRWSALFFVVYISIVLYFLMNLMLAAVYASFTSMQKEKFKQLLLHRRKAAQHAYRLLLSRKHREGISFHHFQGLLRYVDSSKSYQEIYLMFRLLNTSGTNFLSLHEFYNIYDVLALKWRLRRNGDFWYSNLKSQWLFFIANQVNRLVTWKIFEYIVCGVILLSGLLMLVRTSALSEHLSNPLELGASWESFVFVLLYALEAALKMFGLGPNRYFESGWNIFDCVVTSVALLGLIAEVLGHWPLLVVVRHLRILRLFKLRKRYRDVFGTVFILAQRLLCAGIVFLILYYVYAIIGMELFAEYDLTNCCKNTSVESNYVFSNETGENGYYYLNNFQNLMSSYVTLFELTVVNNWYIIMEGHAATVSQWSRIYFMLFYLNTMMMLSIVVASVLDGFLFRISYKKRMSKEDEKRLVQKDVALTCDEFESMLFVADEQSKIVPRWKERLCRWCKMDPFYRLRETGLPSELKNVPVTFTGYRRRTKDILLSFMYKEEITQWMAQAENTEHQAMLERVEIPDGDSGRNS